MNDTFYQIGSIGGLFSTLASLDMGTWFVPPCTRHELIQNEDYPIFRWAIQTQRSWWFGLFPSFRKNAMTQWVWKDYSALGFAGNSIAGYNSQ